MRAAAALFLLGAAALSGCGGATRQEPLNEAQAAELGRAPDSDTVMRDRWNKLFTDPAAVIAAANEFGYEVPAWHAAATGFAAQGKTQLLPKSSSAIIVKTGFDAAGKAADIVDLVRFTFEVDGKAPQSKKEADALRLPVRIVSGFLSRFGVGPGEAVKRALIEGKSVSSTLHGALLSVEAQPAGGSGSASRRLVVRITKSETPAANNKIQPQGTEDGNRR